MSNVESIEAELESSSRNIRRAWCSTSRRSISSTARESRCCCARPRRPNSSSCETRRRSCGASSSPPDCRMCSESSHDRGTHVSERSGIGQAGSPLRARQVLTGEAAELADAVAVMVSELATNSVRHTATEFTVSIDRGPARDPSRGHRCGRSATDVAIPGPTRTVRARAPDRHGPRRRLGCRRDGRPTGKDRVVQCRRSAGPATRRTRIRG